MKNQKRDVTLPDLTFPTAVYGRTAIPMDLRILLYKGASTEHQRTVFSKIGLGHFGNPIQERLVLVEKIHSELNATLISGGSQKSLETKFYNLRGFFGWIDSQDIEISITSFPLAFRQWSDYLLYRTQNQITMQSAYSIAMSVSTILSPILGDAIPLIKTTRLRLKGRNKSVTADDQNLEDIFKFGHLLIDIVNCLTREVVYGILPVKMKLRNGIAWDEFSGLRRFGSLKNFMRGNGEAKRANARQHKRMNDHSLNTRFPLINLRLQAELLIFIGQAGMNLSQARQLILTQAKYTSSIEGYRVRAYKGRKGGDVSFEIFSQYRDHFDKYLTWRKEIFKDSTDLLFPFCSKAGRLTPAMSIINFQKIRNICKLASVKYYSPKDLRKTRINWFYRQSRNLALTAEQAQNTIEVLSRNYLQASFQVAKVEFVQYWSKNDPTLQQDKIGQSPAPGICDGIPSPIKNIPSEAPKPDCIHPSGCLFCEHHRDIDSEDYVWSVASMKSLNAFLVGKYRPIEKNKTDTGSHIEMALEILVQKLKWFTSSNEKRKQWVSEALERCNEGNFHPHWSYLIESVKT